MTRQRLSRTNICVSCGTVFHPWSRSQKRCSQQCWLREHNSSERNTQVSQQTREKRGTRQRSGSKGYVKLYGRHAHRRLAEWVLGRPLERGEIVHHVNHNKGDNRLENLVVMTQSEHCQLHWHGSSPSNEKTLAVLATPDQRSLVQKWVLGRASLAPSLFGLTEGPP